MKWVALLLMSVLVLCGVSCSTKSVPVTAGSPKSTPEPISSAESVSGPTSSIATSSYASEPAMAPSATVDWDGAVVRKIELRNVEQYYVDNKKTGYLFVIEGDAVNTNPFPIGRIHYKSTLIGTGAILASQTSMGGVKLPVSRLVNITSEELDRELRLKPLLSPNVKHMPNKAVPFMMVFERPPSNVKEFEVRAIRTDKVE